MDFSDVARSGPARPSGVMPVGQVAPGSPPPSRPRLQLLGKSWGKRIGILEKCCISIVHGRPSTPTPSIAGPGPTGGVGALALAAAMGGQPAAAGGDASPVRGHGDPGFGRSSRFFVRVGLLPCGPGRILPWVAELLARRPRREMPGPRTVADGHTTRHRGAEQHAKAPGIRESLLQRPRIDPVRHRPTSPGGPRGGISA